MKRTPERGGRGHGTRWLDLHKRYAQVAVIEESGEVQEVFGALGRSAYGAVEV